jgi:hypothetical protein
MVKNIRELLPLQARLPELKQAFEPYLDLG